MREGSAYGQYGQRLGPDDRVPERQCRARCCRSRWSRSPDRRISINVVWARPPRWSAIDPARGVSLLTGRVLSLCGASSRWSRWRSIPMAARPRARAAATRCVRAARWRRWCWSFAALAVLAVPIFVALHARAASTWHRAMPDALRNLSGGAATFIAIYAASRCWSWSLIVSIAAGADVPGDRRSKAGWLPRCAARSR